MGIHGSGTGPLTRSMGAVMPVVVAGSPFA